MKCGFRSHHNHHYIFSHSRLYIPVHCPWLIMRPLSCVEAIFRPVGCCEKPVLGDGNGDGDGDGRRKSFFRDIESNEVYKQRDAGYNTTASYCHDGATVGFVCAYVPTDDNSAALLSIILHHPQRYFNFMSCLYLFVLYCWSYICKARATSFVATPELDKKFETMVMR